MLRYVAFVWNSRNPRATAHRQSLTGRLLATGTNWKCALDSDGLYVCYAPTAHDSGCVVCVDPTAGVVLGTLFKARQEAGVTHAERVRVLSESEVDTLRETRGRSICETHWGSYVLFLRTWTPDGTIVLRGPVGSLPCFRVECDGVTVYFSSMDDFVVLRRSEIRVNYDFILASSVGFDSVCAETGIDGLTAVLGGQAISHFADRSELTLYWPPRHDIQALRHMRFDEAVALMRDAVQLCIGAWASSQDGVVLQLSGGFDSSVVLSCLRRQRASSDITCVNFFSPGSDERIYARSMCERYETRLLEEPRSRVMDLRILLNSPRTAVPIYDFGSFDMEHRLIRIARANGATAIFSGELGDNIFGRFLGSEVLAEYIQLHGLNRQLPSVIATYALVNRRSVYGALRDTVRYLRYYRRSPYLSLYGHCKQLAPSALTDALVLHTADAIAQYEAQLGRFVHPLLREKLMMPGKLDLVMSLLQLTSPAGPPHFSGAESTLFHYPLASQPLVEAFLRIPAHLHIQCAEAGAVARSAFRSDLTSLVLQRARGKCGIDVWLEEVISGNLSFVRETLLEGALVRNEILDRRKLEQLLSGDVTASKAYINLVLQALYVEIWLSRWRGVPVQAAA